MILNLELYSRAFSWTVYHILLHTRHLYLYSLWKPQPNIPKLNSSCDLRIYSSSIVLSLCGWYLPVVQTRNLSIILYSFFSSLFPTIFTKSIWFCLCNSFWICLFLPVIITNVLKLAFSCLGYYSSLPASRLVHYHSFWVALLFSE